MATVLAEIRRLREINTQLREAAEVSLALGGIIGQSPGLLKVLSQVDLVAPTNAPVLILGESGTGKECLARAIHERSRRAHHPLIKVNCSCIPRDLFESEFFGHIRGAFTSAQRDRTGRFQLADGGTIFLDEVGDLPLELQPKLLRVVQEGEFERVGDDLTRQVDVRVIAATNHDLPTAIQAGSFRADLFYRLNVFPIEIPPLRQRKDDIPLLATHFVSLAARKLGIVEPLTRVGQFERLKHYDWPGNVRELQNLIERALILSGSGPFRLELALPENAAGKQATPAAPPEIEEIVPEDERRRRERANILAALKRSGGRISGPHGAAVLLAIKPSTLQSRMMAHKIEMTEVFSDRRSGAA